jgi:hypothetical protein
VRLVKVRQLFPKWMRLFLRISAAYNIGWAIFIYFFASSFVRWITGSEFASTYQVELHAVGLLLLGLLFILTSFYPIRFWYFIAFGVLVKTFGGLWIYFSILEKTITSQFVVHLFVNDFSWAVVLAIITYESFTLYKLVD